MKKSYHIISALLLTGALLLPGCADNIVPAVNPVETNEPASQAKTYTMTVVAGKGEAGTKALSLSGNTLNATWAQGETVQVINTTRGNAELGTLTAQDDGASTTLKGTISEPVANGDILLLKFLSPDYTAQDGTLDYIATHCDYATATITASVSGSNVTTADNVDFENQQAIVKFILKKSDGTAIGGGASSLVVKAGGETTTTVSVTPTQATDELFVAIPAIDGSPIRLTATTSEGARGYSRTGVTFEQGKFYAITVRMTNVIHVTNESELNAAVATQGVYIIVDNDITIGSEVVVTGNKTITLDLNGHTINRGLSTSTSYGNVLKVTSGSTLTVNDVSSGNSGVIKGGYTNDCGGIRNEGTLIFNGGTIRDNHSWNGGAGIWNKGTATINGGVLEMNVTHADHDGKGGAIRNDGTLTINDVLIRNNTSKDGGAIYNASGATMTIAGGTFTGNSTTTYGGGAITNQGTLTVTGGTFTGNTSTGNGGGIYSNGTLNMSGNPVVSGNNKGTSSPESNNVYLAENRVIKVTGTFTEGVHIGLSTASGNVYYTSGFESTNPGANPDNIFFSSVEGFGFTLLNGEVIRYQSISSMDSWYISESGNHVDLSGCYKVSELSDVSGVSMVNGWYVVDQNTTIENRINIVGTVNLILADNTLLDAKSGIHVPYESTLNIWAQRTSIDDYTGALLANAAGQGSSTTGRIPYVAGIGENRSGQTSGERHGELNFHGGDVIACGGITAPGIGGYNGKDITITGGSVFAVGGEYAAGIGCGMQGVSPKNITITGGVVKAVGLSGGAGIGSGYASYNHVPVGGTNFSPNSEGLHTVRITGGHVIAMGAGAGIGGGDATSEYEGCEGNVYIEGGTVEAQTIIPASSSGDFNDYAQAIGHGGKDKTGPSFNAFTLQGTFTLYSNAKVKAVQYSGGNEVELTGETAKKNALRWSKVTIYP